MALPSRASRSRRLHGDYWPGFVDALASLLLVVIFLLSVFILAQFFLSETLSGREKQLGRLNVEVAELSDLLSIERETTEQLTARLDELSDTLSITSRARDAAVEDARRTEAERLRLADLLAESQAAFTNLQRDADRLSAERSTLADRLAALESQAESARDERAQLATNLQELEAQNRLIESERTELLQKLEDARLKALADEAARKQERELSEAERDELIRKLEDARLRALAAEAERQKLTGELTDAERRALAEAEARARLNEILSQKESDIASLSADLKKAEEERQKTAARLSESQTALTDEQKVSAEARAAALLLNQQIAALRQQLASISALLDESEARADEQKIVIADLGKRLNAALAEKVGELQRYRSEFFGRLREVLGNREGIQIQGDRFVFQSEVLFETASAEIEVAGREELARLAQILRGLAAEIPGDIDWILRVDGHTDRRPIRTSEFPSNWELSTARAVSVVKFLIDQGIPANRLAATGFGQYQPVAEGNTDDALRQNRRIEFKFTER